MAGERCHEDRFAGLLLTALSLREIRALANFRIGRNRQGAYCMLPSPAHRNRAGTAADMINRAYKPYDVDWLQHGLERFDVFFLACP